MPYLLAKRNIIERKYAAKSGIPPTTYRSRGFLPCGVGESLLILLDRNGICASSGSACTSGSLDPSHVLLAIGLPHEIAHGSVRFTLSRETTEEEFDTTVEALKKIIDRLRSMSPLYEDFVKQEGKS